MLRAILSIGRQDVVPESLIPKDDKIRFIAASSDHIVLDVTKSDKKYKVGDKIKFNMNYSAMLYLMNSDYVKKVYKGYF
jgi:predicted amino acid racemase